MGVHMQSERQHITEWVGKRKLKQYRYTAPFNAPHAHAWTRRLGGATAIAAHNNAAKARWLCSCGQNLAKARAVMLLRHSESSPR